MALNTMFHDEIRLLREMRPMSRTLTINLSYRLKWITRQNSLKMIRIENRNENRDRLSNSELLETIHRRLETMENEIMQFDLFLVLFSTLFTAFILFRFSYLL